MTQEDYCAQVDEMLKDVHPTLGKILHLQAYDRGHAYGYQEVLNILKSSIQDFAPVIDFMNHHSTGRSHHSEKTKVGA